MPWSRSTPLTLALVVIGTIVACGGSESTNSSSREQLGARTYLLKVPAGYDGSHPVPLVVVVHGYGSSAAWIENYFALDPIADEHGFVIVYPEGTVDKAGREFFNATDACCDFFGTGVDDVGFIDALIDKVEASYDIDPARVYSVGHSNGGFMGYRLACDLAPRFAAIVSLEGAMWADASRCRPSEPVSILEVHGTADTTLPPGGWNVVDGFPNRVFPSVQQTVGDWQVFDACAGAAQTGPNPGDIDGETTQGVVVSSWNARDADVNLWMIQGGTHVPELTWTWPEALYAFLSAHSKQRIPSSLDTYARSHREGMSPQ